MNLVRRIIRSGKFQRLAMCIAWWTGLVNLFYLLNRKAKRVIVFHNVLPDAMFKDDSTNCASCNVSKFKRIIDMVARRFRFSTDFNDPGTVTITFDDGLLNQYEIAGGILRSKGDIPAVIFASGKTLKARSPLDCTFDDQFLFWSSYAPMSALAKFAGEHIESRGAFWGILRGRFAADSVAKGENVWNELNDIYAFEALYDSLDPEFRRLRLSGVGEVEIADMKRRGWKLGWHTESHYPLSSLSDEEARKEIEAPSDEFRNVPFCFPYGERRSVTSRDIRLAEECGYSMAFNCSNDPVDNLGRYFAMRMTLPDNRIQLDCMLSGFKYFLDTGRLMAVVNDVGY